MKSNEKNVTNDNFIKSTHDIDKITFADIMKTVDENKKKLNEFKSKLENDSIKKKDDDFKYAFKSDSESDDDNLDDKVDDFNKTKYNEYIKETNKIEIDPEDEEEEDEEEYDDEIPDLKHTTAYDPPATITEDELSSINTEGESYEKFTKSSLKKHLVQCEYCQKFFGPNLIIKWESTTCAHCYFWTHYNEYEREEADGKYMYIADYIKLCKGSHDCYTCATSMKAECCFICDYIDGDELKWIKERSRLFRKMPLNNIEKSDDEFEIEI